MGKHRVNALHGTALDLILRANARDTLIILGYATRGVVLSTVRAAADLDYRQIVVQKGQMVVSLNRGAPAA